VNTRNTPDNNKAQTSGIALLLKIYWAAFGNLPLIFLPLMIFRNRSVEFGYLDIIFGAAWLLLIITRVAEAKFYNPVPSIELKKYIAGLTGVAAVLLALGHLAAKLAG
jgi:hypothetical protein